MSQLDEIVGSSKLKSASYIHDPDISMPVGLLLGFESASYEIRVNESDDTILLKRMPASENEIRSSDPDLMKLIGLSVDYAWLLTNHRGYQDGVEFEFVGGQKQEFILRIVAIASEIQVQVVRATSEIEPG